MAPRNSATMKPNFKWGSVACDALTVMPFVGMTIFSAAAIIAYAQLAWFAPIACSIFSTLLSAVATYRLWRRTHVRAVLYIVVDDPAEKEAASSRCGAEALLAGFFAVIALGWAIVDILGIVQIASARNALPQPCGGVCGTCATDPHCAAWAANVSVTNPIVNVCPPARRHSSSESNATFSCVADAVRRDHHCAPACRAAAPPLPMPICLLTCSHGAMMLVDDGSRVCYLLDPQAWMFLTFGFTLLWLCCVICRRPASAPAPAVSPLGGGTEMLTSAGVPA